MTDTPNPSPHLKSCLNAAYAQNYKEALKHAKLLLKDNAENIATHKLLALLYGLNGEHEAAHMHYMLLVQFDESYTIEHCMLVAEGYADKGLHKAAGLLCMAAFNRIPDAKLTQFAAECFNKAGDVEWVEKARTQGLEN